MIFKTSLDGWLFALDRCMASMIVIPSSATQFWWPICVGACLALHTLELSRFHCFKKEILCRIFVCNP
jgi:hypothetical protein